jgi:hypothetical protein
MKIFKALFSSGELMKSVRDGADALHYSEEEKDTHLEKVMSLYEPFKLAQRLFMLVVCIPYMLCFSITFGLSFIMDDVSAQFELLNGQIGNIFLMIAIFYFGGGAAEGFIKNIGIKKG